MADAIPSPVILEARPSLAISVHHLTKRYAGRAVVNDVTFDVAAGEVFAILGPNGAGKTTTIEILEGYRSADCGSVSVLGLDPRSGSSELRRRVGLMLQQGGFYPTTTAREVLRLYASFYDDPADSEALLRRVGLEGAARTRYRQLSGGEKQRLSLAVALVGQPELVFLDEPTAGMDPQARLVTWEIIRELKGRGVTFVLTTHLIDEAERVADRVGIIDEGSLIALGSPAALTEGTNANAITLVVAPETDLCGLDGLVAATTIEEKAPGLVLLHTTAPLDLMVDLAVWLRANSIVPRALRIRDESLEDVFLRLTGKDLEE